MTINLALEYIPKRMVELQIPGYHIRFRHLRLVAGELRQVIANSQFFYLVEPPDDVRVESDIGLFDLTDTHSTELQYEHTGTIIITNLSAFVSHLRFIQIIPKI